MFVVHCSVHGLPDLLFEMHPCGLHVCYPTQMGKFGFIQMVEENMKLFSERKITEAVQARILYKKIIHLSRADFWAILSVQGESQGVMSH